MIFINTVRLHELLAEALGDDLVISVALDAGKYYLAVSTHKTKRVDFVHGRPIQSCLLDDKELGHSVETLAKQVIPLFKEVLVERKSEDGV